MLDVSVWGEEQPGAESPERGHDSLHQRGPATRGSLLVLANLSPTVPAVMMVSDADRFITILFCPNGILMVFQQKSLGVL